MFGDESRMTFKNLRIVACFGYAIASVTANTPVLDAAYFFS